MCEVAETFVLELTSGRDGPLVGTIRRAEAESGVSFRGWIALMRAIDRLREAGASGPADAWAEPNDEPPASAS
jgi:hypothetical protein